MRGFLVSLKAIMSYESRLALRHKNEILMLGVMPYLFAIFFYLVGSSIGGVNALKNFNRATGFGNAFIYMLSGSAILLILLISMDLGMSTLYEMMVTGFMEMLALTRTGVATYTVGLSIPYFLINVGISILAFIPAVVYLSGLQGLVQLVLAFAIMFVGLMPMEGLGLIVATLVIKYKDPNSLVQPIRALLVVLSGSIYPITILPGWMQVLAQAFPPYYISEAMKIALLYSKYPLIPIYVSILVLLTMVYYPISLGVYRAFEKRAKRTGELTKI